MKLKFKIFFYASGILVLILFIFTSCKKDSEKNLLGDLRNVNPYVGFDTIRMGSDLENTILFIGQGRTSTTYEATSTSDETIFFINEKDEINFISENMEYELLIKMFTANADVKFIYFDLSNQSNDCRSISENIDLRLFKNPSSSDYFNDSVLIRNKYYYDVYKFPLHQYNCGNSEDYFDTLYYNTNSGIIKLKNFSGEEFIVY